MIPGEYKLAEGDVIANEGRREIGLEVAPPLEVEPMDVVVLIWGPEPATLNEPVM